ncbi:MAG: ATP-binding protein [Oscillospiraceae bacterium]|nr:ATP-binding protein [Oscillospiraceae bacterium]
MAYNEQVRQRADDRLEARRLWYRQKSDDDRARILKEIPALAALEQTIAQLGVSAARAALGGDGTSVPSLRSHLDEMTAKDSALVKANGYAADALLPQYYCPTCRDTGALPDGTPCACLKWLLADGATQEINRVSPLKLCSFESFSLDYYAAAVDPAQGVSARDNMRDNLQQCREFAEQFPRCDKNLLLFGDAGLGKTHLALSVANRILQRGFDVVYCSAAGTLRQIETEYFESGHETATLRSLKQCSLLVLDDLGAEYGSTFIRSALYDILNSRISAALPFILTTNFDDEDALLSRYGEKINSRLQGCCSKLPFFGEDIRIQKNAE